MSGIFASSRRAWAEPSPVPLPNRPVYRSSRRRAQNDQTYGEETRNARAVGFTSVACGGPSEAKWDATRAHEGFACHQLRYMSDGLEINGFLYAPQNTAGWSLPVVILNRGGNRAFTAWDPRRLLRPAYPPEPGG